MWTLHIPILLLITPWLIDRVCICPRQASLRYTEEAANPPHRRHFLGRDVIAMLFVHSNILKSAHSLRRIWSQIWVLSDLGFPGVRSMGPVVWNSDTFVQVMQVMQVMQLMQVVQVVQVIDSLQVIDSVQRRLPFLVAPSGGHIWN